MGVQTSLNTHQQLQILPQPNLAQIPVVFVGAVVVIAHGKFDKKTFLNYFTARGPENLKMSGEKKLVKINKKKVFFCEIAFLAVLNIFSQFKN